MKHIFYLLFLFSSLFGDYRDVHKLSSKKDEEIKIHVLYGGKDKLFKFRWTLYKNGGLVVHRNYDRVVAQNVLYLNHTNQSFRLKLKPKSSWYQAPYLLVKFKQFSKNKAEFEIYLFDSEEEINLKYPKKGTK